MPRAPRTVRFTLPPNLYDVAAAHAEARKLTVHEYIQAKVIESLARQEVRDRDLTIRQQDILADAVARGRDPKAGVTPRWKTPQREKAR